MPTLVETAGHGTRPPGKEVRTIPNRTTTRAASRLSSRPQSSSPIPSPSSKASSPSATSSTGSTTGQDTRAYVVRKEVIASFTHISDRLDDILEECTTVLQFKRAIADLAKSTKEAADYNYDSIIRLADPEEVRRDLSTDLSKWGEAIAKKIDSLGSNQDKILKATQNINVHANGLHSVTKELESRVDKVTAASDKIACNATPYRDALVGGTGRGIGDSIEDRISIEAERKAKQIMVMSRDNDFDSLHPDDIVKKANEILNRIEDTDRPKSVEIEMVNRFPHGGVLLYFNSKEAAKWVRQPEIETIFIDQLAKNVYVKNRPHNILLRGVPVILDPSNQEHLREIEETNGLTKHSILKARWIKPEVRRRKGQTHTHASAVISDAETANLIIKNGLEVCGVKIRPEKLKQDPLQCLKCRRWGHFATNCTETVDACGTCGENHRTTRCNNPDKRHCVSCNSDSHASWDRNCPEFIRRRNIFDENHPENKLVYFPTDENWTLTTKPDRIPIENRFPQRFAVNSIPIVHKKAPANHKKAVPTRRITSKDNQGKEPNTINNYFSRSQSKGKGKAPATETDDLQIAEEYEECFDFREKDAVERLLNTPCR